MTLTAYGELVSFGSYAFTAYRGGIAELPLRSQITDAVLLGERYPVDVYAGGPAPLASADGSWTYWIVAPDGTAEADCAPYVDSVFAALAALRDTVATLTILTGARTPLSCQARFLDCTPRESTREYAAIQLTLIFKLYGEFA